MPPGNYPTLRGYGLSWSSDTQIVFHTISLFISLSLSLHFTISLSLFISLSLSLSDIFSGEWWRRPTRWLNCNLEHSCKSFRSSLFRFVFVHQLCWEPFHLLYLKSWPFNNKRLSERRWCLIQVAHIFDLSGELLLFGPWRILLTTIVGLEGEREREKWESWSEIKEEREVVRDRRRERERKWESEKILSK